MNPFTGALGFLARNRVLLLAVLGVTFGGSFLARPGAGRMFVVELRSATPGFAQLFYDVGKGINEGDSVAALVPGAPGYSTLRFPLPDVRIRSLRLDPIDGAGPFSIRNARVEDGGGAVLRTFGADDLVGANQITGRSQQGLAVRFTTPPDAIDPILKVTGSEIAAPSPFRFVTPWSVVRNVGLSLLIALAIARTGFIRPSAFARARQRAQGAYRSDVAFGLMATTLALAFLLPGIVLFSRTPMAGDGWVLQDPVVSFMTFEPGTSVVRQEILGHMNVLWSNLRGMGLPLLGNEVQSAPLFPLTLLFLPIPQPYYWNLLVVARLLLMGLGAFLIAIRFLRLGRTSALVFTFCLVYGLHVLLWLNHPWQNGFLAGIWHVYFVLRILGWPEDDEPSRESRKARARDVLGLAVAAYGMTTSGFPEATAMSGLLTVFVALPFAASRAGALRGGRGWMGILGALALGSTIGILLGSAQVLALTEFVGLAPRGFRKGIGVIQYPGFEAAKGWLTPLTDGRPPGSLVHHFGLIPAFLLLLGMVRRTASLRALDWRDGAAAICFLFFVLKTFPIWRAFNSFVGSLPILRDSWFIVYFFPILLWSFAFYAAVGMEWILRAPKGLLPIALACLTVLLGATELLARDIAGLSYWRLVVSPSTLFPPIFACLVAFVVLGLAGVRTVTGPLESAIRQGLLLLLILTEADLMHPDGFRRIDVARESTGTVRARIASLGQERGLQPFELRLGEPYGAYAASGIATVDNGAMAILHSRLQALRSGLFNTDWNGYLPLGKAKFSYSWDVVSNNLVVVSTPREVLARFDCEACEPLGAVGTSHLYWNPKALPRAYIPTQCYVSLGPGQSLALLMREHQFEPGQAYLETVDDAERRLCAEHRRAEVARVPMVEDSGSLVRLGPVTGPSIVVLNDNFYPGWRARDETTGAPLAVRAANASFRALVLPEGRAYRIRFEYRPHWRWLALALTAAGGCGMLSCLAVAFRGRVAARPLRDRL